MNGIVDGVVAIANGMCIALVVWGGVLALGYSLGALLGSRGLSLPRRFAVGALAAVIGVALLAPNRANAEDYRRVMEAAGARGLVDAGSGPRPALAGGDARMREQLGVILVHGERGEDVLQGDFGDARDSRERAIAAADEPAQVRPAGAEVRALL